MAFSKGASSRIALGAVVLLITPSMGATGLSSWKEAASDFPAGQNDHTCVQGGGLVLESESGSPKWTKVGDDSFPIGRNMGSMVLDSAAGVHILFGGTITGNNDNRTWTYDRLRDKWTERLPVSSPPSRSGHAMAYDSGEGVTVLFGGAGGYLCDTWTYNHTNNAWTEMKPASSPSVRNRFSMAYDPKSGLVVLFGGKGVLPNYTSLDLGDTWVYDPANNTWTNRTGPVGPSPRCGYSMSYDPYSGLIFLFGGATHDNQNFFQDTWTYDVSSNTWTQLNPHNPPGERGGSALAAYGPNGTLFMFAGEASGGWFGDVVSYDVQSDIWTPMVVSNGPEIRRYPMVDYDPPSGTFIMFSGINVNTIDDLWSYDPKSNAWMPLEGLASPMSRNGHAAVYDSINHVGVIFGGETSYMSRHSDTWTYDFRKNAWDNRRPPVSPSLREQASMCYDSDDGVAILFGGSSSPLGQLADTWTYNVSSNTWTDRRPALSPPPFVGGCMAYDPHSHLAVLFGSTIWDAPIGETWAYDFANNFWTNRTLVSSPSARSFASMVFDASTQSMILFGGFFMLPESAYNDTWSLNTSTFIWTQRIPTSTPPGLDSHAMAFDSAISRVLLFGGTTGYRLFHYWSGDTWAYDAVSNSWTNISPPMSPSPRGGAAMFYDPVTDAVVVFGGGTRYYPVGDTWLLKMSAISRSGSHTSAPKDTGGSAYFGTLRWEASVPTGTDIKLQFRSGTTLSDLQAREFSGPDGSPASFFETSGQRIPSLHNGSRWIQYRACLSTEDDSISPVLTSVKIDYNLLQTVTITSPIGGENWTGTQAVKWSSFDPDSDPLSFDIYLVNSSKLTRLAGGLPSDTREWLWNTSGVPNGTYKLLITASDNNPSIPLVVNTISGDLVIYHPNLQPVNHSPHVMLVYPANNSYISTNSTRIQWKGSDPDGDSLTYTVRYSDHPFSQGPTVSITTTSESLDLSNLTDKTTYYWTLDASDGKSNSTDIPTEIWSFTVRLPPANIPVRFTSTPPTIAWVGQEYTYNLTSIDEDGDIPIYSITSAPLAMTLDSTAGKLLWTPTSSDIGNHSITIQVSDGRGSTDRQTFTVTVTNVPKPPLTASRCTITSPVEGSKVTGTIQLRGTAINGSLPLSAVFIRIDGGNWTKAVGLENWILAIDITGLSAGKHRAEARAFDGSLYSETASVDFMVIKPEPGVSLGSNPWCLPAAVIAIMAGLTILLLLRKKKGNRDK
jgi:hypothetical protein